LKNSDVKKGFSSYFSDHINVIDKIHAKGFEAYFVGGCVRDGLSDKAPYDFDITTNAKPDDIKKIFEKVSDTGVRFGTVSVTENNTVYEITTYRIEEGYSDRRTPDKVTYTDKLYEDLKRRDFTINAMAYDGRSCIIDYFNGMYDLRNRIIRTVGDPDIRFGEDALRILRAVRFAVTLNYSIDERTKAAIVKNAGALSCISRERIYGEISRIIKAGENLDILYENNIAGYVFIYPELVNRQIQASAEYICRLSSVFSNYPDIERVKEELVNMRADNRTIKSVTDIIRYRGMSDFDEYAIRKLITEIGVLNTKYLLTFKNTGLDTYNIITAGRFLKGENDLAVNGYDIMDIGYGSNEIKKIKADLMEEVLRDPELNRKDILLKKLKQKKTAEYININ
jgi:tRNA nucleotidyltransferase (CCA-adding enzyme)